MSALPNLDFGNNRLPLLLQTEAAECGLACLGMVACFHGFRTDLANLRARFSLSMKGTCLNQIICYAESLKLSSRPVRLELHELNELNTPCILHWDLNHFVVLKKTDRNGIIIHDPASGVRRFSYADTSPHFTGIAIELSPMLDFQPANVQRKISISSLIGHIEGLWRSFGLIFSMALALEVFALVSPMFNQWVVDEAIVSADRGLLNTLVIGFALMLIAQTIISMARDWAIIYMSTHLNLQWLTNTFTHLLRLPVSWFEKRHLGDIVSRFDSINSIQRTLTTSFITAILDSLMAFATLGMMLFYSTALSTIVLIAVIFYAGLRAIIYHPIRESNQEALALSAKEQSNFLETIQAVQAIKLFEKEKDRRDRWLSLMVNTLNKKIHIQKFTLLYNNANTLIFGLENIFVFWFGAHMVMDSILTVGMLFAFTSYSGQFSTRMSSLIDKFIEFRMLSLHGERLADIVLESPEENSLHDISIDNLAPQIELINVGFRYSDGEPWVIRNFNLTIKAGEVIALVGPSGCGKTTLLKLLLGLLPTNEGEVRYGGVPIKQLGHKVYRQAVAVVMQNDQLLSGSLADNISFFDAQGDLKRIEKCAILAAVHHDINAMPMGYHTFTGDMGTTLSGGQKQRVLLARALYKSPKVLVLDEATSHLDVECERQVNQAIRGLSITRICVAHRPETIAMAQRVIRLANGVIEQDMVQVPR